MMAEPDVNHESSNMSRRIVVHSSNTAVTPDSAEAFRSLCDALQRNDPNVTSISTSRLSMITGGYGRALGHALQRNTVVSTIDLNLVYLIVSFSERGTFCQKVTSIPKLMAFLLHWMEHSCSLSDVTIDAGWNPCLAEMILEPIMGALVKHGNIQSFEAATYHDALSLLTPFLQANALKILTLRTTRSPGINSDDVYEDCARAVGALHQLESLTIGMSQIDPFLRQLPTSPAFNTTLRELTLDFEEPNEDWRHMASEYEASALCQVLSDTRCRLQRLELQNLDLKGRSWTLLSSALLRSNPSSLLHTLALVGVEFSEEAARLFLRDMQSNPNVPSPSLQPPEQREEPLDPPVHHIPNLRLTSCIFDTRRPEMKLGHMLCGSLLQHITLDLNNLRRRRDFFDVLTTRGTASCLQSMHLENANVDDLRRLAPYIATTVHLHDLSVKMSLNVLVGNDVPVPEVFLSSLRQNGSLYTVDMSTENNDTPNDAIVRRIQVYTMRNRALPQLMATTSFGSNADHRQGDAIREPLATSAFVASPAPSATSFPTMGAVAEHAPQMAPNTFLKAFVVASESLVPS